MKGSAKDVVVGVFDTRQEAERAVEALEQLGLSERQVGYSIGRSDAATVEYAGRPQTDTGEAAGGAVASGILAPVDPDPTRRWLHARLVSLGVPPDSARLYEEEWLAGRAIVAATADERRDEAWDILLAHGAHTPTPASARAGGDQSRQPPYGVEQTGNEANQIDVQDVD